MPYVIVFLVATVAGCAVGLVTVRNGRVAPANPEAWTGTYREETPPSEPAPTQALVPAKKPLPPDPNPHTRKIGAAGLAGVIACAAGAIAFLAYLLWTVLKGALSFPQH